MLAISDSQRPKTTGRAAVLALLKRKAPVSADSLAAELGITGMAVRQHLAALEARRLATYALKPQRRGRPVKLWRPTAGADAHFADSHAALTADLIAQMRKAFGEKGLDRLLAMRTAEQERAYGARMKAAQSLDAKLRILAGVRSAEGYMAEVRRDRESGGRLFLENHCPICVAARACQGLCREELALFQRVLGKKVKIERLSHIVAGAGRCAYRITG